MTRETRFQLFGTTALALALALPAAPATAQDGGESGRSGEMRSAAAEPSTTDAASASGQGAMEMRDSERIPMAEWSYETLYSDGRSAQRMIEIADVDGRSEEDIGEVEDMIVAPDGRVLALVVEIGGFLDMGDVHVAVPWEEIEMTGAEDGIRVPIDEDNIGEYTLFQADMLEAGEAGETVVAGVDDAPTGQRAWRASELIGDYARVRDDDVWSNYGYVSDMIIEDGKVASVVITPDVSYGVGGYYAMPYYGYDTGYGWTPGSTRYDMPYEKVDMADLTPFEYEEMRTN